MRILFRFVVVTSCLLLFWHFLVIFANLPKFILPSPMLVMETFISNFSLIFKHAIVTGSEILLVLLLDYLKQIILQEVLYRSLIIM